MDVRAGRLGRSGELAGAGLLALLAVSVAMVLGNPGVSGVPVVVLTVVAIAAAVLFSQLYAGYLILVACSFTFICVAVTPDRYLNAFDFIVPIMFPTAYLGALRRRAIAEDQTVETGPGHDRIREATRQLTRSVVLFYGLAIVSMAQIPFRSGIPTLVFSGFSIIRTVEALLLFPLGLWWMRSERRIHMAFVAAALGTLLLAIVMLTDRVTNGTARPGMTWILNQPDHTEDTNQAAIAVIQMLALMFAFHPVKPRLWNFLLPVAALTVVVLTQSRNGLLAMVAFLGLSMRRIRVRHVLAGVGALALGAVLAPHDFWDRMAKTVTMTRGSSEVYGWMVRVYGYVSNVKLFMHNWLFGVGYLAGRAMSAQYNDLGVPLGAENFFLETGVGMGVIGLAVLWLCFARMFQLGQVVREVSPAGSLGHRLALVNMPFLVTVVIACLTQDCLIGVVAHAEMVIWFVLLIRAGHVSLRSAPAAVVAPAESGSGAGGVA